MALWAKVQQLVQGDSMKQLQAAYGVHFPIDVRHIFAEWIESQHWFSLEEDNPEHDGFASQLRDTLVQMLENKANEMDSDDNFLTRLRLQETAQQFKEMYSNNPANLVRVIKTCLATEQRLVQQAENAGGDNEQASAHRRISQQFDFLQRRTQDTDSVLRQLQQKQESFILKYTENNRIKAQLLQLANQPAGNARLESEQRLTVQRQANDTELARKAQELLQARLQMVKEMHETCTSMSALQSHILDEQLISWKRQQQLAGNGVPFEGGLEMLQQWCDSLADIIWQNRLQIKNFEVLRSQLPINVPPDQQDLLPVLNTSITGLLSTLVTSTFLIEKQPPQVLKKDSRFTATIRLLVGGRLNVHMTPPTVKATIISEEQARCLLRNERDIRNEYSGSILNNTGTMEYHQANGSLSVTFRNMTLKKIKRSEKKGNETVTEEKFSILFQSHFTLGEGELNFQVWTLSQPVVVTVHGNQECNALATILWDNAFAEPSRIPFQVPERVPWIQLAQALNTKFVHHCGSGLSPENQKYLASKLFGQADDYTNSLVTWSQFNREQLPGRNFTFWEWFYAILKLTKDWLQGPWKDRLILGFVSKQEAQEWLLKRPKGTFLLRFSDSELGGITIAWVADDPNPPNERQVWNLAPFTDKDFKIRGIGDRVKDLQNLVTLFPDIPKQVGFSKFWSNQPSPQEASAVLGYVKPDIQTVIPCMQPTTAAVMSFEDPRTPQVMQPQSPPACDTPPPASVASTVESQQFGAIDDPDSVISEIMDEMNYGGTDYGAEDIADINVNEFLSLQNVSSYAVNN
nr:signal transducer and activator of transcription 1-alpha/beta-like protein [Arenicola marina]